MVDYNTAFGNQALYANSSGGYNTAFGNQALYSNYSGGSNTALGHKALFSNTSGSGNVAIGYEAGWSETGSNKLYIANGSGSGSQLVYGDFSTGDLSLGQTSGTVTVLNDADIDGT